MATTDLIPGSFFGSGCPGQTDNGTPISIKITNTAHNNDSDQITTQAGQGNQGQQQQTQIVAAAGDDVVIGDLNRRFDGLDQKLRFLFDKNNNKSRSCRKCGKGNC